MIASLYAMISIDGERAIDAPLHVFRDDLATVQAQAAEIVKAELRSSGERHIGPELLYHLEHTALLHLLVGARLLRRIEEIEAADARVEDWSTGRLVWRTPLRRWHGRLRTLGYAGRDRRGRALAGCRCICGERITARAKHVRSGGTRSCGCLRDGKSAERLRERAVEQRRAA